MNPQSSRDSYAGTSGRSSRLGHSGSATRSHDRHVTYGHDGPGSIAHHVTRPAYCGHCGAYGKCGLGQGIAARRWAPGI